MITLGYGDVVPITIPEKIYVIFAAMIGCGVFAYSVNTIGVIIQEINKRNNEFRNKIALLSAHMKKRGVNKQLQMKVKKYYEYMQEENQEDNEKALLLLDKLSNSLKLEVLTDIYVKILRSKKIFYLNFSSEFLQELAPRMKEKRFMPEEIILNDAEVNDKIYIIMQGSVEMFLRLKNKKILFKKLSKGNVFGSKSFLTNCKTSSGFISANIVSIVYL